MIKQIGNGNKWIEKHYHDNLKKSFLKKGEKRYSSIINQLNTK
jgi:hypothetical protein